MDINQTPTPTTPPTPTPTTPATSATSTSSPTKLADLIRTLLSNPSTKADTIKMLQVEAEKRKQTRHTAKQYKTVHIKTTCLHCHTISERSVTLTPKEHVGVINVSGRYQEITFRVADGGVTVASYTQVCDVCIDFVSQMPRDELEERYIAMLQHWITFNTNSERIADKQALDQSMREKRKKEREERSRRYANDANDGD